MKIKLLAILLLILVISACGPILPTITPETQTPTPAPLTATVSHMTPSATATPTPVPGALGDDRGQP
jgi:hypothetical protein